MCPIVVIVNCYIIVISHCLFATGTKERRLIAHLAYHFTLPVCHKKWSNIIYRICAYQYYHSAFACIEINGANLELLIYAVVKEEYVDHSAFACIEI